MQKCHNVGLKVALKSGRIDLHKIPEGTHDRVVDHDLRRSQICDNLIQCFKETGVESVVCFKDEATANLT
jgi:hypothetical protein